MRKRSKNSTIPTSNGIQKPTKIKILLSIIQLLFVNSLGNIIRLVFAESGRDIPTAKFESRISLLIFASVMNHIAAEKE